MSACSWILWFSAINTLRLPGNSHGDDADQTVALSDLSSLDCFNAAFGFGGGNRGVLETEAEYPYFSDTVDIKIIFVSKFYQLWWRLKGKCRATSRKDGCDNQSTDECCFASGHFELVFPGQYQ